MSVEVGAMEINGSTELTGILGYEIPYTLSPALHNSAFRYYGMNWVYLPLRVAPQGISAAISGLKALGFRGFNVTIPHKLQVVGLVDRLEGDAEAMGAVNTVVIEGGTLVGHNTDAEGFSAFMRELEIAVEGEAVMIIGAGGAARAVALAVARGGASRIMVANRTVDKAESLAEALKKVIPATEISVKSFDREGMREVGECSLVVNCTPLTGEGDLPLDMEEISPHAWAVDLKYGREKTAFLREAGKKGARIADGAGMLLHQAGISFRLWTGMEPPLARMRSAIEEADKRRI